MRLLQLIGTTLFAVAIYSCGQGKSQSDERVPVNTDSTSCEKELYSYYIDDNIILQSKILPQFWKTFLSALFKGLWENYPFLR